MVVRVTLEIALRKEFDYLVPPELADQIEVGSRVKVPFGPREVPACVTAILEQSTHTNLRSIVRIVGQKSLVTPQVIKLTRWIAEYYCCAPEVALKSVLPDSVRKDHDGYRKRLVVRLVDQTTGTIPKLSKRQQEILKCFEDQPSIRLQELLEKAHTSPPTIHKLEDLGLIQITSEIEERDPYSREKILPTTPLPLNPEQEPAVAKIKASLEDAGLPQIFLLHGVTGSGKTEVYLQAIARTLEMKKGAIVLVPEIALTPQTVERFKARFSSGNLRTSVAVLHSHLSAGERHDEWHKIRNGRARIVIGARSAIFAPVEALGLIIVDEEHEHSYKQEESPRYNARDVAIVRGQFENAVVVLGTATPSMESYYNALRGKYQLLEMKIRADDKKLPVVRVIDMRQAARKEKGVPIFSHQLKEAMTQRLEKKEQTILFLNRRGFATSLQCPLCGYVAECPNCSVSLTYHRLAAKLCCHICGHETKAPELCPVPTCKNPAIRYSGLGTEKVERALEQLFPRATIQRMDSDILKRKEDYRRILGDFRVGKIDILVGTQMIAKGLHFPNVTLVGIVHADLSLHIQDFRAGERTFQLLTQVAGRAGRGDVEGEVFVQSFTPFHPAIQYARRHDFPGFYEQEMEFREQLKYPPVARIALITLKGRNEEKIQFLAEQIKKEVEKRLPEVGETILCGPAPAPLARAETHYRYQILLRTKFITKLSHQLNLMICETKLPEETHMIVDIDPVNLH